MLRSRSRAIAALTVGLVGVAAAAIVSACSDPESPCLTVYANECNTPCQSDVNCANGLYCAPNQKCTADCTPDGGQCDGVCDARGRCIGGDPSGGQTNGFMAQGTGAGTGCASLSTTLTLQTPTVILLVDQSGSMNDPFPGPGGERWSALYDALMNPATGVVKQLEASVRFGLVLYRGRNQCPSLERVPIQLNNYDAIDAVYSNEDPGGDTPTGESVDAIVPELLAFPEPGVKVIVLATDGEPDTCAQPNPNEGQPESIAAVQKAYASGILTYIISVGEDVSLGHQQDVANAGAGKPLDHSQGDAPFYPAGDHQALVGAFNTIIGGVQSCVVSVEGTIDPAKACEGTVYIDNVPIPCNDPNGWRLLTPSSIELTGTACQTVQSGQHTVTGSFPCGVLTPK